MKKYLSVAAFAAALVFAAAGLWMPPQGVIDGSVLILVAQLLVLCATFLGINLPFESDWLSRKSKQVTNS